MSPTKKLIRPILIDGKSMLITAAKVTHSKTFDVSHLKTVENFFKQAYNITNFKKPLIRFVFPSYCRKILGHSYQENSNFSYLPDKYLISDDLLELEEKEKNSSTTTHSLLKSIDSNVDSEASNFCDLLNLLLISHKTNAFLLSNDENFNQIYDFLKYKIEVLRYQRDVLNWGGLVVGQESVDVSSVLTDRTNFLDLR